MSSARYGGAWPDKDEKTKHASYRQTSSSLNKLINPSTPTVVIWVQL